MANIEKNKELTSFDLLRLVECEYSDLWNGSVCFRSSIECLISNGITIENCIRIIATISKFF